MRIHELKERLRKAGAGPSHEQRILRLWSHALPRNSGRRLPASFFPAPLMEALPAIEAELAGLAVGLMRADCQAELRQGAAQGSDRPAKA